MVFLDDERRITDANPAARLFFGLSRAALASRRLDDFKAPEQRPELERRWRSFLEEGSSSGSGELVLPKGDMVRVEYSATAEVVPGRHLSIIFPMALDPGPDPSEEAASAVLSARQREVLALLAMGDTNEQVAKRLFISAETVRTHLQHARKRLGATTRTHAVALALHLGEISLEGIPASFLKDDPQPT
jgi:PAS domain S-box-containing protein